MPGLTRTHIVDGDEGVVNRSDSSSLRLGLTAHQASNAAEAVDTNRNVTRRYGGDLALTLQGKTTSEALQTTLALPCCGVAEWQRESKQRYLGGLAGFVSEHLQREMEWQREEVLLRLQLRRCC